jgi:Fe-S-cluster containining protein
MPGILCEHCTAACCRYVALPIETPTERSDFDDIRWYLLHENISVFVEDGDWYISMQTSCRHIAPDGRCLIYPRRPRICRKYTTENCDYHSGDYGWEAHFTCPEHLEEYLRARSLSKTSKSSKNGDNRTSMNNQKTKKSYKATDGTAGGRAVNRPAGRARPRRASSAPEGRP